MEYNNAQSYYRNGCHTGTVVPGREFTSLKQLMYGMLSDPLKDGYSWIQKEKYTGSKDLRPYCWEYDDVFVKVLIEQGIPELLRDLLGYKPLLLHAKLRINLPGQAYSTWHRDTTFYRDRVKGVIPPVVNVHYYPRFDLPPESQLQIWTGTHLRMNPYKLIDRLIVRMTRPAELISDDGSFTVLDTSLIHRIPPTKYPRGAIRLMYSFGREFLSEHFPQQRSLHEMYRAMTSAS